MALDGSPRAEGVLAYAISLAEATGARLILFRAFEVPTDMRIAWPLPDAPLEATFRREAEQALENHARSMPAGLLEAVWVEMGVPWKSVCKAAQERKVDLVVLGSHGYDNVDRILGTTAAKIVNHVDRPVLIVRPTPAS